MKKIEPQIRWVAVNPQGIVCGPCMKTEQETKLCMLDAFINTTGYLAQWHDLQAMGYNVIECWIMPIGEKQ